MNKQECLKLIQLYSDNRGLWDSAWPEYTNREARDEVWEKISQEMNIPQKKLKKKMVSLLGAHRRELSREKQSRLRSSIQGGGYESRWFAYKAFSFMRERHIRGARLIRPQTSDVQAPQTEREQTSEEDEDEDDDDRGEQEILIKQEPSIETYCMEQEAPREHTRASENKQPLKRYRVTRPLLKRKIVKENTSLDSRLLETLRLLRKSDLSRKKDECDSFGEYIAISLRKHDERTQSMIKQAINNILFEQEMKKYSAGHYTVVLQGVDENPLVLGDEK